MTHAIKHLISLTLLLLLASNFYSQTLDDDLMSVMNMRSIGPAGMSGRVTAIAVETENPEVIYAGTASGGVWKSESGGISWEPIFDDNVILGIGSIDLNQRNLDEIWVGTGEGNPRNSHTTGGGIYASIDGGHTWECKGLEATKNIHRVIINEDDSRVVYAGALGSIWGPNSERGVYRTKNGGKTWENTLFINDSTGCAELIQDPSNPNKLFAAMWEYGRKPWTFNSGGDGSGLYVTHDGGDNWKLLGEDNGLPKGILGRMGLAISAANPDVVYALVESKKTGLYKSTDGGQNFELISTENIGNRPFYYAEIHADPQNENILFNLWTYMSKSIDAGKTFTTIMDYPDYHPDHHAFYIHPNNSDFIIEGNDGGLNITRDGGENWEFVRNIPVGQFYHINVDDKVPYNVYGGMQDNGSWKGPGFVWHVDGIRNEDWKEVLFGDGFDVVPIPGGDLVYAMYQGGSVNLVNTATGNNTSVKPVHPDGETLRFNWNGALAIEPNNPKGVYMGSQFLHYSSDMGNSWMLISEDLTTNNPEKQKQAESGGLTTDATQAENHTTITCIAPSALDPNEIWVGTDDGRIHYTVNKGQEWNEVSIKGMPKGSWVAQIELSEVNKGEVFIAVNDYRRNNFKPYLFHSSDMGKKWKNIAAEKNIDGYSHCIKQDFKEPNLLFYGTEHGLFVSTDHGNQWVKWTENFPQVSTIDLKIQKKFSDLIIGTFGRAAYIHLFAPQEIFQASFSRPNGERFRGDHFFSGQNKSRSANVFYYLNKNDSLKGEDANIRVNILTQQGDSIRTFMVEPEETKFSSFNWRGDSEGIRFPSREKPKDPLKQRGGGTLLPGTYLIHAEYDGYKSETSILVSPDPREWEFMDTESYMKGVEDLNALVSKATQSLDDLEDARRTILLAQKLMGSYKSDSTVLNLLDSAKSIVKFIDSDLETLYMNHREQVGYETVTVRLNDLLYNAANLLLDRRLKYEEGSNSYFALQNAKEEYEEVKAQIVQFLNEVYEPFKAEVEALNLSPFDNGSR